ncbi:MAG: SMC family ATPase [Chloroflexi bacterium]|nr:SMC family ATPase [Chloroflexota bacterium]
MIRLKRLYVHNFKQLQELELHFPDHARVLVQGKNEAGKSTLFEALYFALFGNALATESGARGLDDLIRYQVEKARVELDVQAGARVFQIRRTITRGKSNVWELDIRTGDAVDEIRGNTVVNKRLIGELGFDGDALLNTCFVEQKKLEKLEGLTRAKREESLAKLLNLDALVRIESDLKLRAEDKQESDRLKKRADLAAIQAELPPLEQQLAHTESQLNLLDLRGATEGALGETRAVQQLDAQMRDLAAQRDQVTQRVERIEALKDAMTHVKDARDAVERIADHARTIERLKQEQADARRAAESIPSLQSRLSELRHLARRLQRLTQLQSARDHFAQRAAQLADAHTRLAELSATITREENALAQVDAQMRQAKIGAALENWIAARREALPPGEIALTVQQKKQTRDQLARRFRIELYGGAAILIVVIALAVATVALTFSFVAPTALGLAFLIALALGGVAAFVALVLVARAARLWRDWARASEELGQAQGEAHARASVSAAQLARIQDAETRLAQLDIAIPETPEQAQHEIDARAPRALDDLRAAHDATRERLLHARAIRGELQQQNAIADPAHVQAERARCERAAQKAARLHDVWRARTQARADALGIVLAAEAAQRAYYEIAAQIEQAKRRAKEDARLSQEIAQREQQARDLQRRARDEYAQARTIQADAPEWSERLELGDYNAFGKNLRAEYDALGGEQAIKQARELEGELGRRQGERATRQRNADVLLARVRELFSSFPSASATTFREELTELAEKLQSLDLGDEATLRVQQRELVGRVHSLRDRQTQLERELGLVNVALDPAACRAEWEANVRAAFVRERGVEIASLARKRIVQKVLPATMDYLRRLLPALTRDRYHDAQLDPETYKIQVWDERASPSTGAQGGGAFKEKNIFSGGTKDQFSLALRLAFALATLPQERGAAPSFIFLDEPLGSFDDERADALIYLLTEGEIARAFDQIFLISHVHVNEQLFTHRVVLENGRVAETNLRET